MQSFISKANKLLVQALNEDDLQEAQRIGIITVRKLKADAYLNAQKKVPDEVRMSIKNYMTAYKQSTFSPNNFDPDLYQFDVDADTFKLSQAQTAMYNYLEKEYAKDFITKYELVNNLLTDGVLTRKQAVAQVLKKYNGPTVQFKNGTNYPAKAYFKTLFKNNQRDIARKVGRDLGNRLGTKVFIYSARSPSLTHREVCLGLAHKPVAFEEVAGVTDANGKNYDVINLYSVGYGTPEGPLGIGCGHDIFPIVDKAFIV